MAVTVVDGNTADRAGLRSGWGAQSGGGRRGADRRTTSGQRLHWSYRGLTRGHNPRQGPHDYHHAKHGE